MQPATYREAIDHWRRHSYGVLADHAKAATRSGVNWSTDTDGFTRVRWPVGRPQYCIEFHKDERGNVYGVQRTESSMIYERIRARGPL